MKPHAHIPLATVALLMPAAAAAPAAGTTAHRTGAAVQRPAAHETFKGHVTRRSCNKVDYRSGDEVIWMRVKLNHLHKGAEYTVEAVHNPDSQSAYRWIDPFTAQHRSVHTTLKINGLGLSKSARPPLHKMIPVVLQFAKGETIIASRHDVVPKCHGASDRLRSTAQRQQSAG